MGTTSEVLEIIGKDLVTPMLRQVNGLLGTTAGHGTLAEKAMGRFGGAVNSLTGNIRNLVTSPLGLLGLGGGLFAIDGFLKTTISRAQDFGLAVSNMMAATGLAAPQASLLVDVLDRFGISGDRAVTVMGRAEKNIFTLTATTKLATKFWDEFHFSVRDSTGHLVDANTLLLRASDYFNGHASAAEKDALMMKIYGKTWTDLIPVLTLGSKGIKDAQTQAAALGLQLNSGNVADLAKMRQATLDWNEALGALELQIGVALLPDLVDLAKTMTSFVTTHSKDIVAFFQNLAKFAQEVGANVQNDLIPAVEKIVGWWNNLDPNLKKLLIGGFIANTLTGGAITGLGTDIIKSAAGALIGQLKNMATGNMNVEAGVVNVGGVAGTAAGAAGAGEGGLIGTLIAGGLVSTVAAVALPLAAAWVLANLVPPGATAGWKAPTGPNGLPLPTGSGTGGKGGSGADQRTPAQIAADYLAKYPSAGAAVSKGPSWQTDVAIALSNVAGINAAKAFYARTLANEVASLAKLDHLSVAQEQTKLAIQAQKTHTSIDVTISARIIAGKTNQVTKYSKKLSSGVTVE